MKYKAYFGYVDKNNYEVFKHYVKATAFSVIGGAVRKIDLSSATDIGVTSEFEQARQYRNIRIYMPPTSNGEDMEVAVELTNFAIKKKSILFDFHVSKYTSGKLVEELNLLDENATIAEIPSLDGNRSLVIEVLLPSAILTDATFGRKGWIKTVNI